MTRTSKTRRSALIHVEVLEDRCTPAVITVTTAVDEVDDGATSTGLSLREAILIANDSTGGTSFTDGLAGGGSTISSMDELDTIVFDATVFTGMVDTITLDAMLGELPQILEALEIDGTIDGGNRLTINAEGTNRIFNIDMGISTDLSDMILTNGVVATGNGGAITNAGILTLNDVDVTSSEATVGHGGGIFNEVGAELSLNNAKILSNIAGTSGGGIANLGTLTIDASEIDLNEAQGNDPNQGGGGIFNSGTGASLTITNGTSISDNKATGTSGSGGGILNFDGATYEDTGSTIESNVSNRAGGGIEDFDGGGVTLTNTTLFLNVTGPMGTANPGNGGGLHITGAGTVDIIGGVVKANIAAAEGGGLWNSATGTLTVDGTLITQNTSQGTATNKQGGGGVFNTGGVVTIANATISNNISLADDPGEGGGGIFNNGKMTITDTMITGNTAIVSKANGGGIFNSVDGNMEIIGGLIKANQAARAGGGIENDTGTLIMTDVAVEDNTTGINGGGLHISGPALVTVNGGTFTGNVAGEEGGGLWNSATGTLIIQASMSGGTLIQNNEAQGNDPDQGGGGVFNTGGTLEITGATINDNSATGTSGSGGGILNAAGTLTVTDSKITANVANRAGGGIEDFAGTSVTLTNVILDNNVAGPAGKANPGNGGGIHTTGDVVVTITGGTINDNLAAAEGGGVWNSSTGTMTIDGTEINQNTAAGDDPDQGGGGLFNDGGTLTLLNSTVNDNQAIGTKGSGGGLFNNQGGTVTVTNTTFSKNVANRAGGAIEDFIGSLMTLNNVVMSGNVAGPAGFENPGNGGGLHITGAGTVNIIGGTVKANVAAAEGGGLWNSATGTLTVTGTVITGNTAQGTGMLQGGGGVFNTGGTVVIADATISGNTALGDSPGEGGGGIFNNGNMTITNTTISGNTATVGKADGGGILNSTKGILTITGGSITGNKAARAGGGIENDSGKVTVTSVTINTNQTGVNGGGIHTSGPGIVNVTSSTFSGNSAGNEGGGLWNSDGGTMKITTSTIRDNLAVFGGGVFNDGASGDVTITVSTLSGNSATTAGGGLLSEGGTVTVVNSTISTNTSGGFGAGMQLQGGKLVLQNSTIAKNTATTGGGGLDVAGGTATAVSTLFGLNTAPTGPDINGPLTSNGFNLISDTSGATIGGDTATNVVNVDPLLGPLQNNGGPTQTHALLPGSPALNKGSNPLNLMTDQRGAGFSRQVGLGVDIGAFESQAPVLPVGSNVYAVGAGSGGSPIVNVYDASSTLLYSIPAFEPNFFGGVRAVMADVNGDGVADVIVGNGPGRPPEVRVFDGVTKQLLYTIQAFEESFTGGVFVAAGDFNGDGAADIVISPDQGGGPRVRVISGADGKTVLADFLGIQDVNFRGGARVSVADINGDGRPDLLVAAGFTGGPRVAVFDGSNLMPGITPPKFFGDFFVFEPTLRNGVFITGGDLNGDGFADLIVGAGPGGGPRVFALSGAALVGMPSQQVQLANFFAGNVENRGGIRVAAKDLDGDANIDLVVGDGEGAGSQVTTYLGSTIPTDGLPPVEDMFTAFGGFNGGVFVG